MDFFIVLYVVEKKNYLRIRGWCPHQSTLAKARSTICFRSCGLVGTPATDTKKTTSMSHMNIKSLLITLHCTGPMKEVFTLSTTLFSDKISISILVLFSRINFSGILIKNELFAISPLMVLRGLPSSFIVAFG